MFYRVQFYHIYVNGYRRTMFTDQVVMGDRKDSLLGMVKFSGNDGAIVWPLWKDKLYHRIKFELGDVAIRILEGKLKESEIKRGDKCEKVQDLIDMIIAKNRTDVCFRSEWAAKEKKKEGKPQEYTLTMLGERGLQKAITKVKMSYFDSINEYGLVAGSEVQKDYIKQKSKYDSDTLPSWFGKMDRLFGVEHGELYDAYVEQLTSLRVIKTKEDSDVLKNLLSRDTQDDICHGHRYQLEQFSPRRLMKSIKQRSNCRTQS